MTLHDPYIESKPPPPVDASVLELLQTDRFFDQGKGYDDPDAAIIGELSAVDDEIDACRRSSNLKDMSANTTEGQALAELCSVDRLVDTCRKERVAEGDLFDCYSKSHSRKKNTIVPHLHAPAMCESGDDASTMMDLLSTDELVDGKRHEQEAVAARAHALHMDLLSVDAEMDRARYQEERPATVLDALHNGRSDPGQTTPSRSDSRCRSNSRSSRRRSGRSSHRLRCRRGRSSRRRRGRSRCRLHNRWCGGGFRGSGRSRLLRGSGGRSLGLGRDKVGNVLLLLHSYHHRRSDGNLSASGLDQDFRHVAVILSLFMPPCRTTDGTKSSKPKHTCRMVKEEMSYLMTHMILTKAKEQ